ncbi:GNAT family N-acetyltransferase [Microvirga roseola]|uniref:GNAT family N-acetyltransferase n=1 Tax=Microvirga roseola TaxID=2883126 RepID=UPI001E3C8BB6|nr:GNAT family N-acetyltransferase [Microvirga roseola]
MREASIEDVPAILALIKELAAFENLSYAIQTDEARLREHGFGPEPRFRVLLAESNGKVLGFLSYMIRYSIWSGSDFLNLDDLFVSEAARGRGIGRALMHRLSEIAAGQGLMVRWELLVDNEPAKAFYKAIGATLSEKLIARWSVEAARSYSVRRP